MFDFLSFFRRKRPCDWHLIDPRPTMAEAKYTFFVPSQAAKDALEPGDLIKMIFESPQTGSTERMWVIYKGRTEDGLHGTLDNQPFDIPGLDYEDVIHFQDHHIITIDEPRACDDQADAFEDQMFTRCHVDSAILQGTARIDRIERREPIRDPEARFADNGWHILTDQPADTAEMQHVAIGAVLNRDDSFFPHIDEPPGTKMTRQPDGSFARVVS